MSKSRIAALVSILSLTLICAFGFLAFAVTVTGYSVLVPVKGHQTCGHNCRSIIENDVRISLQSELLNPRGKLQVCFERLTDSLNRTKPVIANLRVLVLDSRSKIWIESSLTDFTQKTHPADCNGMLKSFVMDFGRNGLALSSSALPYPDFTSFKLVYTMKNEKGLDDSAELRMFSRTLKPFNLVFGFY